MMGVGRASALVARAASTARLTRSARRRADGAQCVQCLRSRRAAHTERRVYVCGAGVAPVTRQQEVTLDGMGAQAVQRALHDSGVDPRRVEALYVGNMMSGMLSKQQHLGPLIANAAGLDLVEASTAEACCGAGGAALRFGYLAVMSGELETVAVVGAELMTHADRDVITEALATASHWPTEGDMGETFVSLNGQLMAEYMRRYNIPHSKFFPFAHTAHANASTADHAVFKNKPLTLDAYESAPVVTDPIQLFDASPTCDGAACVILTSNPDVAAYTASRETHSSQTSSTSTSTSTSKRVRLASSAAATDLLAVSERADPLHLRAIEKSALDAMSRAGVAHKDVDIFELHDAYTSMACLALENAGFVARGEGIEFAADGHISLTGSLPIATFGGLKARGHPVGATGVYQAAEMFMQLQGTAGKNQVNGAEVALIQNVGGSGASVFAHVLLAE